MINIPNILTSMNMLCGSISIFFCLIGKVDWAIYAILLGIVFDFLDGFVARLLKQTNPIGKQLDSLADMVTFGLAPGVLMMVMIVVLTFPSQINSTIEPDAAAHIRFELNNWYSALCYNVPSDFDASIKYLPFCALIIPFFSMFRLAKFTVDEKQSFGFIGMPTPLNTFFFLFFPLYFLENYANWKNQEKWISTYLFDIYFISGLCFLMSILLVSNLRLMALKFETFKISENKLKFGFIIASIIIIILFKVWAIPLIVFLYLSLSIIYNFINKKNEV